MIGMYIRILCWVYKVLRPIKAIYCALPHALQDFHTGNDLTVNGGIRTIYRDMLLDRLNRVYTDIAYADDAGNEILAFFNVTWDQVFL